MRASRPAIVLVVLLCTTASVRAATAADAGGPLGTEATHTYAHSTPIGELRYTPGRGLSLESIGLHVGGYASLDLTRNEGNAAELSPEGVSLLFLWHLAPRLQLFSELEVEHPFRIDDEGHVRSPDNRFSVERLYAEVGLADAFTVRIGTFLTPVGRWNLVHAAPLVWTTSRPLVTTRPFDARSTGVLAFGSFFPDVGRIAYSLYAQVTDPLDGNPPFTPARHAVGGRLVWTPNDAWSFGASAQSAERAHGWRSLGGLDFLWRWERLEVQGEGIVTDGGGRPATVGGYVQAAFGLTRRFYFVERVEHFAAPRAPQVNLVASGVLFRALSNTVLKLEYLAADTTAPGTEPGLKASAAILF
jgi:hypothetical protein